MYTVHVTKGREVLNMCMYIKSGIEETDSSVLYLNSSNILVDSPVHRTLPPDHILADLTSTDKIQFYCVMLYNLTSLIVFSKLSPKVVQITSKHI